MNRTAHPTWEEPPAGDEEVLLADFLDAVLDRVARGEPVPVASLLGAAPGLVERGAGLLRDVQRLLGAAEALHGQSLLLRSDLLAASAGEAGAPAADDESAGPMEPLPDPFPGEYRLRRRLGRGAFGTVWLAEDLRLGRPVALKTLRSSGRSDAGARALAALRKEARLLAAVRHPNIVQVHAWRQAGGEHYLVLQYVAGGSLADRVRQEGPLPWQLAGRYTADAADGLLEVHARGIIHRDVKPANLLWDPETEEALLTDFGVSARLAESGTAAGTPFYMPPEAFEGHVGPAQDVYGLAASLFWLVTGSVPFPAPAREQLVAQVRRGLPDPDARCAGLPGPLEQLIRAGLAADPGRRPGLRAFHAALRSSLNQLLADSLLLPRGPARPAPVHLRLTVSRQAGGHTFVPAATTPPPPERLVRDLRRVPPRPGRVDVRTGDRLRVEVEADRSGFVTVFNIGPTGNLNLLHPADPSTPLPLEANRPLHIPDVELAPPAGPERLFAVWSPAPLPLRPEELLRLAGRAEGPGSGPYRATRDMARVQESVRRLSPEDWHAVVLELDHRCPQEDQR
jgi:serine/threonine protein kinase